MNIRLDGLEEQICEGHSTLFIIIVSETSACALAVMCGDPKRTHLYYLTRL